MIHDLNILYNRHQRGNDGEMELTLELQSRQVVQKRMGQRIRKEVWDDMEVKGKAIKVSSELNYNVLDGKPIAAAPCM